VLDAAHTDAVMLGDVLEAAARRLGGAGLPNARREATQLFGAVAGLTPGAVWMARQAPAAERDAARFEDAVAQRAAGVPFAYAVGQASFRTLTLRLDRRALIPRPETEGLVDLVLPRVAPGGLAADIGTGSGCLALALAVEGRFERVVAVDRSPGAAALARENVRQVRPGVPVEVIEGDLLQPLLGRRWRVIVSNPPYLSPGEYAGLDAMVRDFEPRDALVSGPDGLAATAALLAGARGLLEPGGLLALEIDERRAEPVRALGAAAGFAMSIHDDLFGKPRYALAVPREEA
jgi:release factor glutamine methyltransferase